MHRREQRVTEVARHLFSALPTKLKAILIISNALQILNENKWFIQFIEITSNKSLFH